jgi:hypothetical protein
MMQQEVKRMTDPESHSEHKPQRGGGEGPEHKEPMGHEGHGMNHGKKHESHKGGDHHAHMVADFRRLSGFRWP